MGKVTNLVSFRDRKDRATENFEDHLVPVSDYTELTYPGVWVKPVEPGSRYRGLSRADVLIVAEELSMEVIELRAELVELRDKNNRLRRELAIQVKSKWKN